MTAPTLSSATPNQGPTAGGTSVTLIGTGLTTATAVKFGSTAATSFTVQSDTMIIAVAPAGTGAVSITVTTGGGTSNALTYTYVAAPVLTSAGPSQGPVSGGTSVTLIGSHFTGATSVKFGSAAATFSVVSDTQITATAPGGTGPVLITVTTVGGTSTANVYFYYLAVPTLTAAAPNQGPVASGTTITLTGAHFTGATAVKFGTASAAFGVLTDTQITAIAPAGTAGQVNVTVTTAAGVSNTLVYTYIPVPTITGISPSQGPASGGTSVTLVGSQLTTATSVLFGTTAVPFSVVSDGTIVATAPAVSGTVQVTVVTAGGTSNAAAYTGVAAPGI